MDKLVFKVFKYEEPCGDVVRISKDAREVVNQIQRETGLPASKIVSECIRFISERYEVKEV